MKPTLFLRNEDGTGVEVEKAIFCGFITSLLCDLRQIIVLLGALFPYL